MDLSASGSMDVSELVNKLNDQDKAELSQFLQGESQRTRIQQQSHMLTGICWKKCITGNVKSSTLDKSEETCLANCVERFMDLNTMTMKHLAGLSKPRT